MFVAGDEVGCTGRLEQSTQELLSQAAYLNHLAANDHIPAKQELTEGGREHRLEQSTLRRKQAASLRRQIQENYKAHAELTKRREAIEQRMREW